MSEGQAAHRGVRTNIPPGASCAPFSTQALDDYVRVALPIIRRILAKRGGDHSPEVVPFSPSSRAAHSNPTIVQAYLGSVRWGRWLGGAAPGRRRPGVRGTSGAQVPATSAARARTTRQ